MLRPSILTLFVLFASLTSFCAAAVPAAQPFDFSGYKGVLVEVRTEADLVLLSSISHDLPGCHVGVGPTEAVVAPDRMADLQRSGLSFKVLSEDLGPVMSRHLHRSPTRGDWDDYLDLDEIIAFINDLAAARPDLCSVSSIGTSIEGRDIWALHLSGTPEDPSKPAVFYHGLQHAREWITGSAVLYLANHLVNNYDSDPCISDLMDRADFYLAPCVNPDGYLHSWTTYRLWRKNRRLNPGGSYGVDLNRNWAEGWGGLGSSGTPSHYLYRGPSPFSEPETTALSDFIIDHPNIRAYMDYHSYGQLIIWPYGYTSALPPEPDASTFDMLGSRMQRLIQDVHGVYYRQGPVYTTIYPASGGSVDWVYGNQDRFSFTIELRPKTAVPGFELPPEEILPTCEENLPAILYLSEWATSDLSFSFHSDLPERLTAGIDTIIEVNIGAEYGSIQAGSAAMLYRYDVAGPFIETPLLDVGGGSYQALLPATNCTSTPEFYFSVTSVAGQQITSPCAAPSNVYTADVVTGRNTFFSDTLDADRGWTTPALWAFGQPTGGGGEYGGPDPTSGHTGDNVYGYNLDGDYENGLPERHLTSTPIDCTGRFDVQLGFWRWLGVEHPSYDHAYVRVSNNGTDWTVVWQNRDRVADTSWVFHEADISAIADDQPTVFLRWTMGAVDTARRYCGWNIDDVTLFSYECQVVRGDYNGDGLVNLGDFAFFGECLGGPDSAARPGCGVFDFQGDDDVDLDDFSAFQATFDGG